MKTCSSCSTYVYCHGQHLFCSAGNKACSWMKQILLTDLQITSSHGPYLVHFLPTSARVLWACYCYRWCRALFLQRGDISVPSHRGKPTAKDLGLSFWRRRETNWACGSRCWICCACAASYRYRQAQKSNQKSC